MAEIVVASACCCGIRCRWHGKRVPKSKVIRQLEQDGVCIVPVCPEMLGGLDCPRPPVRRKGQQVFITDETRTQYLDDVTAAFELGTTRCLEIAQVVGAERAFLLRSSPSCDVHGITGRAFRDSGLQVVPTW